MLCLITVRGLYFCDFPQHGVCAAYVQMFSLVPVLVQFSLESRQVMCLLMAEVRVRVSPSCPTVLQRTEGGRYWRRSQALLGFRESAWVVHNLSCQLEMPLYLCPFAGQWHFCLRSAVPLRSPSCSLETFCTHTNIQLSVHNIIPWHFT